MIMPASETPVTFIPAARDGCAHRRNQGAERSRQIAGFAYA
jgi:hypothetical protein